MKKIISFVIFMVASPLAHAITHTCSDHIIQCLIVTTIVEKIIVPDKPKENNNQSSKLIELKLDSILKAKTIKESPVYHIPNGQEKTVEDSIKIVHTVTTSESSLDTGLKLNWSFIQADIRNEIQKATSKSNTVESEIKRTVKIIGDGQAIKVIWSELYRTGIAKIETDGKIKDIPFEYKEDFDLVLEAE